MPMKYLLSDGSPLPRSMFQILIPNSQNSWCTNFHSFAILLDVMFDLFRLRCFFIFLFLIMEIGFCEMSRGGNRIEEGTLLPMFMFWAYCLSAYIFGGETYIYQLRWVYLVQIAFPDNPCRTTLDLLYQPRPDGREEEITFPISNRM